MPAFACVFRPSAVHQAMVRVQTSVAKHVGSPPPPPLPLTPTPPPHENSEPSEYRECALLPLELGVLGPGLIGARITGLDGGTLNH